MEKGEGLGMRSTSSTAAKLSLKEWTSSASLIEFVSRMEEMFEPVGVHFCDGSEEESAALLNALVDEKKLIKLNEQLRPNSFLARSDPDDVARVEQCTYICSERREDAGPTNNWRAPDEMRATLNGLMRGSMRGRTMYVMPFAMGPVGSPIAQFGVQVTDSPYVVANMRIMTRMGTPALRVLEKRDDFVRCIHTVGAPLSPGQADVAWPCNKTKHIAHFPESRTIISFGSGYGGNALLGKKCFALRIASALGRREGWLAEHMLIVGVTDPRGRKRYVTAAFPSACGKTNLAMLRPTLPGWKVETVGDDIAWMRPDARGVLRAINPEAGFFGLAPGTNRATNPHAMDTITRNTLFTNCALTREGDVWWEGMTPHVPEGLTDWRGRPHAPGAVAAHPNARFTAPTAQCPVRDADWEREEGVPISAILFGGRREALVPLVLEARSWAHGVFMGASVSSANTAAVADATAGVVRHDPFAMLPFCGYHMGDYFGHWVEMEKKMTSVPKVYQVNWFRKDDAGNFMWPGFGDNMRVLKWVFERCEGEADGVETPVGVVPKSLDVQGVKLKDGVMEELLKVDVAGYRVEMEKVGKYFEEFGEKFPVQLKQVMGEINQDLSKRT